MYGHGDVIRGQDASWTRGQGPWTLAEDGDRLYGRGTADNKGQHSINIAALAHGARRTRRQARLQRHLADRDRRGNRLARPGRVLRAAARAACRRRADRLRRAAAARRPADAVPGHARRGQLRPEPAIARRRAPLGQLGRAAAQPGHGAGLGHRQPGRRPWPHPRAGPAPAADSGQRARGAGRTAGRRRAGRPGHRPRLGRARPDADRARAGLERAGGAGHAHRQPGLPGQRHSRPCQGAPAVALRGRHRHRAGCDSMCRTICASTASPTSRSASRW